MVLLRPGRAPLSGTIVVSITFAVVVVSAVGAGLTDGVDPAVPLAASSEGRLIDRAFSARVLDGGGSLGTLLLAVRWRDPEPAVIDVLVDWDGSMTLDEHELVFSAVEVTESTRVLELPVPVESTSGSEDRVFIRLRRLGTIKGDSFPARPRSGAAAVAGKAAGECGWSSGFSLADLDGTPYSMVVWDDGTGPALFVGGDFAAAGGVVVNNIAKWDGSSWSALSGPSGTGTGGTNVAVNALAVWDDGGGPALYAAGAFTTAGGITVNRIAKWDGTSWSPLVAAAVTGLNQTVEALAVWDDGGGAALYAGGYFETVIEFRDGQFQAVTVNYVAKWDGSSWSPLTGSSGTGVYDTYFRSVQSLIADNSALYVGGEFSTAGGVTANNVAAWDGSEWVPLVGASGNGVDNDVYALAIWDDGSGSALYVAGNYVFAGGIYASDIAKWNGSEWSDLSGPSDNGMSGTGTIRIESLVVSDDGEGSSALYAGGFFQTAGGVTANNVARWNGTAWSAVSGPAGTGTSATVEVLHPWDDGSGEVLLVGGGFAEAGGAVANRIAAWDGSAWSSLSPPSGGGLFTTVKSIAYWSPSGPVNLYAGGLFSTAGGSRANYVARWNGSTWNPLSGPGGTGTSGGVNAVAAWDGGSGSALYAGGLFKTAGGVDVWNIAKWNGSAWSALTDGSGTGVGGVSGDQVYSLASWNDGSGPGLFVGGSFWKAGGVAANSIAKWNGSQWSVLTGPSATGLGDFGPRVHALAVWDDGDGPALYAGGSFATAGGVTANNIAKWNGSSWSPLTGPSGTGTSDQVLALATFDDGSGSALYAGGMFYSAGGVVVHQIAKWDGATWSAVGSGLWYNQVRALTVWDDGSGPALFAGGDFGTTLPSGRVENLARWNGTAWSAMPGPSGIATDAPINALIGSAAGASRLLTVGGEFTLAGGVASSRIARWACEPPAGIFADGFESGSTSAWSASAP